MIHIDEYGNTTNLTGEITKTSLIIQSFIAKEKHLSSVGINFGTYNRENSALITVEILNQNGEVIKTCVFNSSKFIDNSYQTFKLNCDLISGERYFLKIYSTNGLIGKSVTARWGYRKHFEEIFYLNNNSRRGELACFFEFDDGVKEVCVKKKIKHNEYVDGLISVVIPCYNSSEYLRNTLKSIFNQTYNFLEVIVVDDASDDLNKIETIVDEFDCVFVKNKIHRGAPTVRNDGERLSKGEYLFFCDSDVVLKEKAFETMIQKLQDNINVSWVYCNFQWGDKTMKFYPFNREKMLKVNCSSTMSMLKHEEFPKFDESLLKLQDWDLFLTIMKNGGIGIWEDSVLFETPYRKDGITNNSIPEAKAREIIKRKHPEIKGI